MSADCLQQVASQYRLNIEEFIMGGGGGGRRGGNGRGHVG